DRPRTAASLLSCMAPASSGRPQPSARRADCDIRVHCLVELSDGPRPQQHPRFRLVISIALRQFAFAFGTAFALCYALAVGRQLALFTVFPSLGIVLPGTVQSRDVADPALSFLAPAMYWYGWTATATIGALAAGVTSLAVPEVWTRWIWPGWLW